MEFQGRYQIPAAPALVWAGLNDPEILKACIPGCEEISKTSPTDFLATATLKIGPVKARFKGKVALSELDPPKRCVLSGEGQGGMAGFAKGSAEVLLSPEENGTFLSYTAHASVGGKLAQIGQRLIDGAAKQIADDFFGRFAAVLSAAAAETAAPAPALEGDGDKTTAIKGVSSAHARSQAVPRREGVSPEIWVVGLIGVVVILLLLFSVSL
jgi:carbon monoxide dehydrogenase subunit G